MRNLFIVKNYVKWLEEDKKRKNPSLPSIVKSWNVKEIKASEIDSDGEQFVEVSLNNGSGVQFVINKNTGNVLAV
jgi:hypothetical protein